MGEPVWIYMGGGFSSENMGNHKKQQLDFLDEHSRSEVRIQAVRLGKYPGYPICGHQNMGKVWQSMINHEVLRHLILD